MEFEEKEERGDLADSNCLGGGGGGGTTLY